MIECWFLGSCQPTHQTDSHVSLVQDDVKRTVLNNASHLISHQGLVHCSKLAAGHLKLLLSLDLRCQSEINVHFPCSLTYKSSLIRAVCRHIACCLKCALCAIYVLFTLGGNGASSYLFLLVMPNAQHA